MSRLVKIHIFSYLLFLFLYLIFPYRYHEGIIWDTIFFIIIYFLFLLFVDIITELLFEKIKTSKETNVKIKKFVGYFNKHLNKILILGLLFLGYDYFVVKGINIFNGLSGIRNFLNNDLENTGISSPFSVLGYLFLLMTFTHAVVYSYFFKPNLKINLVIIVATLFISVITGGRTTFLLLIGVFLFNYRNVIINSIVKLKFLTKKKIFIPILLAFFFINYVFYDRAQSNDIKFDAYTEIMAGELGGEHSGGAKYDELKDSYPIILNAYEQTGLYAFHSLWSLEGVLNTKNLYGNATFNNWRNILKKFGLTNEGSSEWLYSRRFISWQGGLYYDFGFFYLFIIFFFLLIGKISYNKMKNSILGVLFYSLVFMTFMFSPVIILTDILVYPVFVITNIIYVIIYKIYKLKMKS